MISRELFSGFMIGAGLTGVCCGLYLIYVGNKLIKLSNTSNTKEIKTIELNVFPEDDIIDDIIDDNNCDNTCDINCDVD